MFSVQHVWCENLCQRKTAQLGWLLVLLMLFASTSTSVAQEYNEAPMLAERVANGELPPVGERLPLEPVVVEPLESIGQYGGTYRVAHTRVHLWWHEVSNFGHGRLAMVSPEDGSIVPHAAKGWELADDAQSLTLFLREGLKWSDGHPFTADDILFWYEDVLLNEDLTPTISSVWRPGGELMQVEKVDDYTVQFSFAVPNPGFVAQLALVETGDVTGLYLPKHWLSKVHPTYASEDELNQRVQEAEFEFWWELFQDMAGSLAWQSALRYVDAPTLSPYVVTERSVNITRLERNPYYWKVDPEGNQLPYVDAIRAELVQDVEVQEAKVVNGELDLYVGIAGNMGLYHRHAEDANIQILPWTTWHSARSSISLNLTHQDPVLRNIFQDVRFRRALSLAIDRDEVNDLVWLGLATPMQSTVVPPSQFYREEFATAYADFDPEEANRLLDEMGLEWDSQHEYRLRPDGERLRLTIDAVSAHADWVQTAELLADYWTALGIQAVMQTRSNELFSERIASNVHDVAIWGTEIAEIQLFGSNPFDGRVVPISDTSSYHGVLWGQWHLSGGSQGEEPPSEVLELFDLLDTWYTHPDEDTRNEAMMEIVRSQAENLWHIGVAGIPVRPMILNANLRNVPEDLKYGLATGNAQFGFPETWYFEQ